MQFFKFNNNYITILIICLLNAQTNFTKFSINKLECNIGL